MNTNCFKAGNLVSLQDFSLEHAVYLRQRENFIKHKKFILEVMQCLKVLILFDNK